MVTVFLGAGFSVVGGVPLASCLFDRKPEVDRVTRRRLVERVHRGWNAWTETGGGQPEEYLAYLSRRGSTSWAEAVWYVGLSVALATARVEHVGAGLTVTRHNVNRTTGIPCHEAFWSLIFRRTWQVAVVTTNCDILAERGLRHEPRPRVPRPGFRYGFGTERLAGGGYPSYAHIQAIRIAGHVPLLKLHGSVSWSLREGQRVRYHDCRPAVRGDPAIVAPATTKEVPPALEPIWAAARTALSSSSLWLVVGYSLPHYDLLVRERLFDASQHGPGVHVFDPDETAAQRWKACTARGLVYHHPGLPEGLQALGSLMDGA